MFIAAVPATKRRKGLFALRSGNQGTACYCGQENLDYYLLQIPEKRKKPDYSALRELYPRFSGRVIAADTLQPEQDLLALYYDSQHYERQIMLRLCTRLSELLPMPLIRRTVGLVDPNGIYAIFAETLIKYSPIVKVYTKNPEAYNDTCRHLLEYYGAPLLLTEHIGSLNDCVLLFSPDLQDTPQLSPRSLVVFGTRPQNGEAVLPGAVCLRTLSLTQHQQDLVPSGIDPILFFGAACDLSGKREFASLSPKQLAVGRRIIEAAELPAYVQSFFV